MTTENQKAVDKAFVFFLYTTGTALLIYALLGAASLLGILPSSEKPACAESRE